jgi:hypothetical protein
MLLLLFLTCTVEQTINLETREENATLYHQLYEHASGMRYGLSTIPKDNNPFTAIKSRNLKGIINENRSNGYVSPSSSTNINRENSLADD